MDSASRQMKKSDDIVTRKNEQCGNYSTALQDATGRSDQIALDMAALNLQFSKHQGQLDMHQGQLDITTNHVKGVESDLIATKSVVETALLRADAQITQVLTNGLQEHAELRNVVKQLVEHVVSTHP